MPKHRDKPASDKALLRKGETGLPLHRADGTHPRYFHQEAACLLQREGRFFVALGVFASKWAKQKELPSWLVFSLRIKGRGKSAAGQLSRLLTGSGKAR